MLYKQSISIAFDETSSYWLAPKNSAFHWSPRGSLVSIGPHFIATRVVHLPKSTETSLITESDQSGPNHQLLQLCTARIAWSDSDQAVRAVHSCNSWFSWSVSLKHSCETMSKFIYWFTKRSCLKSLFFSIYRSSCSREQNSLSNFGRG